VPHTQCACVADIAQHWYIPLTYICQ